MKNLTKRVFLFLLLNYYCSAAILAQGLVPESPQFLGFSEKRLERIETHMEDLIEQRKISGAVTLVAREGKMAYFEAFGTIVTGKKKKMDTDQIFRIASMTKAITTVGAMMLYEEGKFNLDDPVSKYLPEFENMKVMVLNEPGDAKPYHLIDAVSPVTIRNLLTQTSGISYGVFGNTYIRELYRQNNISDGLNQNEGTIGDMVKRLAKMPLIHQPGAKFTYGLNTDVLGYLIEIISGEQLDEYLKDRIFDPLKMNDTYFYLPKSKVKRLAGLNKVNEYHNGLEEADGEVNEGAEHYSSDLWYNGPDTYFSGGGGLVSTAQDYAVFLQMLLNKGQYGEERLLGVKTVELMTSSQSYVDFPGRGMGFGFGFSISGKPGETGFPESEGTYGWSGYFSSFYWVDPQEELIGIIMTQTVPYNSALIGRTFKNLVYQAIVD